MTAPLNLTIRMLGGGVKAAGILAVSSVPLCFAQAPVATLGIPTAPTAQIWSPPVAAATQSESSTEAGNIGIFAVPPIQVNAYVPAEIESARRDVDEVLMTEVTNSSRALLRSLDTPAVEPLAVTGVVDGLTKDKVEVVGKPGVFLSVLAEMAAQTAATSTSAPATPVAPTSPAPQKLKNHLPRMTGTPAEPQLSPSKWVHQPLVAASTATPETLDTVQATDEPLPVIPEAPIRTESIPAVMSPARPLTEIRRAAMRQRASRTEETFDLPTQSQPIQPGYSVDAIRKTAMDLISEAQLKLDRRVYLTAEDKAIAALELIAQSIDTRQQSSLATRDLRIALTAIREAEDFVGKFGMVDGEAITRMIRSHSTEILKPYNTSNLSGLAAADVYLDWSRRCLTPLATADPLGSEAIRILAISHRSRDSGTPFGIATAVHLMRAASDGTPENQRVYRDYQATLEIAGLQNRSRIALAQGTALGEIDDQRALRRPLDGTPATLASARSDNGLQSPQNRDVEVLEVSPEQFAAISPAMAGPLGTPNQQWMPAEGQMSAQHQKPVQQRSGTYRPEHVNEMPQQSSTQYQAGSNQAGAYQAAPYQAGPYQAAPYQASPAPPTDNSVKGRLSRAFNPITRILR